MAARARARRARARAAAAHHEAAGLHAAAAAAAARVAAAAVGRRVVPPLEVGRVRRRARRVALRARRVEQRAPRARRRVRRLPRAHALPLRARDRAAAPRLPHAPAAALPAPRRQHDAPRRRQTARRRRRRRRRARARRRRRRAAGRRRRGRARGRVAVGQRVGRRAAAAGARVGAGAERVRAAAARVAGSGVDVRAAGGRVVHGGGARAVARAAVAVAVALALGRVEQRRAQPRGRAVAAVRAVVAGRVGGAVRGRSAALSSRLSPSRGAMVRARSGARSGALCGGALTAAYRPLRARIRRSAWPPISSCGKSVRMRAIRRPCSAARAFTAALGSNPLLLFLTVSWCDHCRQLSSEIKAIANAVRKDPNLLVARADADEEPAIAQKLSVRGFPTILFFPRGFDLHDKATRPAEFSDWRWAEVIAEFVNNHTTAAVIQLTPRDAFLKWRKKHPYNLGLSAAQRPQQDMTAQERDAVYDDGISKMGIREPTPFTAHNFDSYVYANAADRYMVLFYEKDDPFLKDIIVQWRQASSAFTGADNVTIAFADVTDNQSLLRRFQLTETPSCLYFPACDPADMPQCKKAMPCNDDLNDTENIIQFISDRVMYEIGIEPHDVERGASTYSLTEEEYQQMKANGVLFANEEEHAEQIKQLYEERRANKDTATESEKDEL
ncbi:Thioredoxin [Gracilaria domingensis]|nr:Thioredoxin [Gracilaria domingensis]